jgi:hypothetical protein
MYYITTYYEKGSIESILYLGNPELKQINLSIN